MKVIPLEGMLSVTWQIIPFLVWITYRSFCSVARMPVSLNLANFLFQIFNTIGQVLLQFSKFLCSTVYSLPVISLTWTLAGWNDVCSLINTDGSIPALKTLPGKVFALTLPRGLGLGSRLIIVFVLEPIAWCWSVMPTHTYCAGPHPSQ